MATHHDRTRHVVAGTDSAGVTAGCFLSGLASSRGDRCGEEIGDSHRIMTGRSGREIGYSHRIKNLYRMGPFGPCTGRPTSHVRVTFTWFEPGQGRTFQGRQRTPRKQSPRANDRQRSFGGLGRGPQNRPPRGRFPPNSAHGSRFTANPPRRHVNRRHLPQPLKSIT